MSDLAAAFASRRPPLLRIRCGCKNGKILADVSPTNAGYMLFALGDFDHRRSALARRQLADRKGNSKIIPRSVRIMKPIRVLVDQMTTPVEVKCPRCSGTCSITRDAIGSHIGRNRPVLVVHPSRRVAG